MLSISPDIAWPAFFPATGAPPITDLNVGNPDFFKGLHDLLQSTDIDTIKTYLRWQLINGIPGYALPTAFDEEDFNFYGHELRGQPQQRARWKRCSQATDGALGEALGETYVKAFFPPQNKARTVQMVKDIEDALDREVDTLTWMSAETKVKAKAKLHLVADKIGYPDHWRDYSSLKIVRGDAVGNVTRSVEFEAHRQLAKIGKPVDRGEWGMTPPTVNAYYNPSMNDINFPAGILQAPFYSPEATDAENYGHAGAIVGHELTHGFDDEGRQFDAKGNFLDWWTPSDSKQFTERASCVVKEYDGFVAVDQLHVNGQLTLGENLADLGGLKLAFLAYLDRAQKAGVDLTQKGGAEYGNLTPEQQFFVSYGQGWCQNNRPEDIRLRVQTDPHSPEEFRVNGVVVNLPQFQKAFACKTGQPMAPKDRCTIW